MMFEGMRICVENTNMEDMLVVGKSYYIKEIADMPGHCIAIGHNVLPLVGIHMNRFE